MGSFFEGFVGGFAGSLKENLDRERIASEEEARELRKLKAKMELEKEFEQDIIDSQQTRIESDGAGGFIERRFNKRGQPIGHGRPLTAAEAQEHQMGLDKAKAELSSAQTEAEYKPRILQSSLDTQAASREASRESAATSRHSRRTAGLSEGRAVSDSISRLQGLLNSIENEGTMSDPGLAETIAVKLERAVNTIDDPNVLRGEVIKLTTEAERLANRAKTSDSARASSGGGSDFMDLINGNRSLDADDERPTPLRPR